MTTTSAKIEFNTNELATLTYALSVAISSKPDPGGEMADLRYRLLSIRETASAAIRAVTDGGNDELTITVKRQETKHEYHDNYYFG